MTDFFMGMAIGAHAQHSRQKDQAIQAEHTARRARSEIDELRRDFEKLRLAAAATWEVLRDHNGLRDVDLMNKIREIDLRDGKLDGRISTQPRECPACRRVNRSDRPKCLYCGHETTDRPAI